MPPIHPHVPVQPSPLTEADYQPGLSVDCVIFGFHDYQLKVLLLAAPTPPYWALAGGFVLKEEDVASAATRVLHNRTGLRDIFLQQFYLFGSATRIPSGEPHPMFTAAEIESLDLQWVMKRFVSAGYYALVDYTALTLPADAAIPASAWWELNTLPPLILDHRAIIAKALDILRQRLRQEPIGYNLLPEKFTMSELQRLYEAILGYALDRRNFLRKILSYGVLRDLNEVRQGVPHKAPRLYSFDTQAYQQALAQGLRGGW